MSANWYKVADFNEFKNGNVPQRTLTATLEDFGDVDITLLNGIAPAVIFQERVLVPNLNERNPAIENGVAAFVDASGWLWVGVENAAGV